ncbi:MAG: GAF domain-containing protein [Chloroflexales bacterium]
MTFSTMRRPRRTNARWHARAVDLARRLSASKRRYAALVNESQRQSDALARLDHVRSVIGRENSVDMILRVAIEAITGMFDYPSVSIYMMCEDGALVIRHGIGHTPPAARVLSHSMPIGHVAHTGEPLMITDTRTWTERLDLGPGVASLISAPLRIGGHVAGVIHIESSQPDALGTEDLVALLTLSDHIGKAMERTHLRGDLQRTVRETAALNHIMSVITSAKDTHEALDAICADLGDVFGVPQTFCALLNADRTAQTVVAEYRSADVPAMIGAVIPMHDNLFLSDLFLRRQPVALSNVSITPGSGVSQHTKNQIDRVSLLVVPVLVNDDMIGTISLSSAESHVFTPEDSALAQRLSTTIGHALTNLRLHESLRQDLAVFLSTTRHEIREPMQRVIGMAEQFFDTPLSANQREYAEAIHASSKTMLMIINTILDVVE